MGEGQQTEAGERAAQARGKMVRLPRDWLGPREELVPFGPRSAPPEADETPPSPADFWGEQSAELQSAVRGPAVCEDPDDGPDAAPAIRFGRVDRRAMAGVAAVLMIAAATVVALVANSLGPRAAPKPLGGSKIGFAAVLSGGISGVLRLDLGRTAVARVATPKIRRTRHRVCSEADSEACSTTAASPPSARPRGSFPTRRRRPRARRRTQKPLRPPDRRRLARRAGQSRLAPPSVRRGNPGRLARSNPRMAKEQR